jgi:DNA mismatch repair protein, C-terminal domain
MLEVSDDGHGVPLPSRPFLCTPHATSKLNTLDDLQCGRCMTLGFRGEALYSLANLSSNVVIATRTKDEALAQRMQFNPQGHLIEESIVAMPRKVGTTVCVQEFLHAVPVRRADFLRRLPMQRSKLIALCQGYALFCAAGTSGSNSSSGNGNTAASSSSSRACRADNARRRHYQYYRPPCQLRLMDMISRNDGSSEERIILQTPHQLQIQSSSSSSTTRLTVLLGRAISAILGTTVLSKLCEVSINVTDVVVAATASKKDATAIASNDRDGSDDDDDDEFLVNPDGTPRWTVAGFISKALPATPTASLNAENNRKKGDSVRPINGGGVKASRRVGHIPTTNTGNPNHHSQPGNTVAATASAGHQFFAINGRPVEMPKLARLFNEQWRNCHSNSSSHKSDTNAKKSNTNAKTNAKTKARGIGRPSIILQFTIPFSAYDINLSPDKRQAVLLGEDDILQRIKEVVSSLWQSQINPADAVQFQSFEESALATVAAMKKLKSSSGSRSSRSSSSCASPDNRKMDDDNDALSSPMPTTTAEQLEGSGRFNRRYAFSHDVRKARLQHEFDDGRKRPDFSSGGNSDIDDVDDDDDDEEGRRRRRPDYNNYQPGYGPDENDDQLDAMLWQQEQIKRQLQAQEKELQRQQQQAAAEALFAARQKEQASSSSSSPTRKHSTSSDNIENNGRDDRTAAEECTAAAGATTTTAMRLTESLSSSIENAKTAQGISAATTSMITPSPSAPRQFPQIATMTTTTTTTTAMATRSYTNDNDADTAVASSASSDGFMTRSNGSSNTTHVERRQWQVTQQRFNHSHDDDDTDTVIGGAQAFGKAKSSTSAVAGDPASSPALLSPTLDRPPSTTTAPPQKDDIRLRLNQFRAAGAGTAVDSTRSNGNMSCANTRSLDKQQSSQPKRKKGPTFSLEQFGFQKPTSTRKTATAKASAPSMTGKPNRYNEDSLESTLNGERRRPKDDETNENSEKHDSSTGVLIPVVSHHDQQAPENTATSPAGANSADTNMDSQDKQESEVDKDGQEGAGRYQRKRKRLPAPVTNASNASNASAVGGQEVTAAMNVVDDSPRSFAEEDMDQSNDSSSRERSCTQPRLSSLSQDSVFPTPTITWDTFAKGGTNQVLLESRRERLAMHERKQSLQEMQQEQQKESSSSSSSIVTLGKEDFKDMTIIGQFNKGFILAKSRNNHLWIMDRTFSKNVCVCVWNLLFPLAHIFSKSCFHICRTRL